MPLPLPTLGLEEKARDMRRGDRCGHRAGVRAISRSPPTHSRGCGHVMFVIGIQPPSTSSFRVSTPFLGSSVSSLPPSWRRYSLLNAASFLICHKLIHTQVLLSCQVMTSREANGLFLRVTFFPLFFCEKPDRAVIRHSSARGQTASLVLSSPSLIPGRGANICVFFRPG